MQIQTVNRKGEWVHLSICGPVEPRKSSQCQSVTVPHQNSAKLPTACVLVRKCLSCVWPWFYSKTDKGRCVWLCPVIFWFLVWCGRLLLSPMRGWKFSSGMHTQVIFLWGHSSLSLPFFSLLFLTPFKRTLRVMGVVREGRAEEWQDVERERKRN